MKIEHIKPILVTRVSQLDFFNVPQEYFSIHTDEDEISFTIHNGKVVVDSIASREYIEALRTRALKKANSVKLNLLDLLNIWVPLLPEGVYIKKKLFFIEP